MNNYYSTFENVPLVSHLITAPSSHQVTRSPMYQMSSASSAHSVNFNPDPHHVHHHLHESHSCSININSTIYSNQYDCLPSNSLPMDSNSALSSNIGATSTLNSTPMYMAPTTFMNSTYLPAANSNQSESYNDTNNNVHNISVSLHSAPGLDSINLNHSQNSFPILQEISSKKRKSLHNKFQTSNSICSNKTSYTEACLKNVKQEPGILIELINNNSVNNGLSKSCSQSIASANGEEYAFEYNNSMLYEANGNNTYSYLDSVFQCIKFFPFQQNTWHTLLDSSFKPIAIPIFKVDADKGFNFSNVDDAFVCQKKNHFQLTVHVHPLFEDIIDDNIGGENVKKSVYIKLPSENEIDSFQYKKVDTFTLHFYGVKVESQSQTIRVEQSQSDRSKKPFQPVKINLFNGQISKTTIGRLHFNETTANNMRKKGKPNPDQRYFYLVAALCATIDEVNYTIVSHASERIIVRASNPGQFENDLETCWQKSPYSSDVVYHNGKVGINTDKPEEALVVHGNLKITGDLLQPSDLRVKECVNKLDTSSCLKKVSQLNLYSFRFKPIYEQLFKRNDCNQIEVGVLAQDVLQVIPEAVRNGGHLVLNSNNDVEDLLVVNKERIFMEGLGAVKELNSISIDLNQRMKQLEKRIANIEINFDIQTQANK